MFKKPLDNGRVSYEILENVALQFAPCFQSSYRYLRKRWPQALYSRIAGTQKWTTHGLLTHNQLVYDSVISTVEGEGGQGQRKQLYYRKWTLRKAAFQNAPVHSMRQGRQLLYRVNSIGVLVQQLVQCTFLLLLINGRLQHRKQTSSLRQKSNRNRFFKSDLNRTDKPSTTDKADTCRLFKVCCAVLIAVTFELDFQAGQIPMEVMSTS
jgi:hypothetical protein